MSLGELTPDDVDVQVVHGRTNSEDELIEPTVVARCARPRPTTATGTASTVEVTLGPAGPFGYTVRVLPKNPMLASPAELGVVALPGGSRAPSRCGSEIYSI